MNTTSKNPVPFPAPLKAVLFDLDGVLVDSEPLHLKAWALLLAQRGMMLPPGWDKDCVGLPGGRTALLKEFFPDRNDLKNIHEEKKKLYLSLVEEKGASLLYEGVAEELQALRSRGLPLAVVSSNTKAAIELTLRLTGLEGIFQTIIAAEMVERGKPFPDPYLMAAKNFGVSPGSCVVMEDSKVGVAAGVAAGCFVMGIATGGDLQILEEASAFFPNTRLAIHDCLMQYDKTLS